jgi:SAM-dependent methyltransferase
LAAKNTYDRVALDYEARIVPYYAPIAEHLVKLARPRPGMSVVDVGAGTGLVARVVEAQLRPSGVVVLVDKSAPMLEVARIHMPRDSPPYVFVTADAQDMKLAGEQFDLAVAQFSGIEELPVAIREVFRVLKSGGRLAMAIWGPNHLHGEYSLLKSVREEIGAPAQPRTSSPSTVAARLRGAGFVSVSAHQKAFPGTYTDVEAYVHYRGGFPWKSFFARRFWRDYLPAIARQAELRRDRKGRVVIRRSVTFLTARKPGR